MAVYTGNFEVQRFQLEFTPQGTAVIDEDQRVITFHSIKLVGGSPTPSWDPADFLTLDTAFRSFWTSVKSWYSSGLVFSSIRAYRAGPNVLPPQTPTYEALPADPGGSGQPSLPPQVALSVTEMAQAKPNWGRFYMPNPVVRDALQNETCTTAGRPSTTFTTAIIDAADTLYEAARVALCPFVIYRKKLDAGRPTGNPPAPSSLPERPAEAAAVEKLQVDDVWDVVRSRRWETPTLRTQRAVGP